MDAYIGVRARIARAVLARRRPASATLGAVTLHPHQVEAVRRLGTALDEWGGALLADAPGLGKTFVALAVASARGGAVVAAPAALRAQWMNSARRAGVTIHFVSLETLSRRPAASCVARLLIIDEAHHLRTPTTARYARAAALALGRDVLLITATPVHNHRADRTALLALFLGARAATLADSDVARLVVRRSADASLVPRLLQARWVRMPQARDVAAALRRLPPPLPALDGRAATALMRQGLALAWSSSVSALGAMLTRSAHRAAALDDALADGRWPTRAELRAWTIGEDASQLAFASMLDAPPNADFPAAREQLLTHRRALDALRATCHALEAGDALARARWLERLMRRHRGACIIAFSRFESTVECLWRALRRSAGVVAISGRRVRSAGGGIGRRDLLAMLADTAPLDPALPLRLVLATDLLGEGVDLRRASVIVHLDRPWTPALAAQREGRAARLGAPHAQVAVYAVRPPDAAERMLTMSARLERKRSQMEASVAPAEAHETLVRVVRPWAAARCGRARVAAAHGAVPGWIAVLRDGRGTLRLLSARDGETPSEDDARAVLLLQGASDGSTPVIAALARAARRSIAQWYADRRSAQLAGAPAAPGRRRLLALLDQALSDAPLHERGALQVRAARLRIVLDALRGAGMDQMLATAPRGASHRELIAWLEAHTAIAVRPAQVPQPTRRARVLALLVLA